jgi:alkylation response protein AidB-like acyl-CoA dehydrogenase
MEMTIGRDRWQHHLKTKGDYYRVMAAESARLHAQNPNVGAGIVSLVAEALASIMMAAQTARLTRNQHILFRIGEMAALVEAAAAMSRRAAAAANGTLVEKTDKRFSADTLAAIARVNAREVALKVTDDGIRWVAGGSSATGVDTGDLAETLAATLRLNEVRAAQAGLIDDMNQIATAIYANVQV